MFGDEEKCETCRFWLARSEGSLGNCRRYPPTVAPEYLHSTYRDGDVVVNLNGWQDVYPETLKTSWCGEYVRTEVSRG